VNAAENLAHRVSLLRRNLERAFSAETALSGGTGTGPSAGQCAATACIVLKNFGGDFVSAKVNGESHWFNRIHLPDATVDVDLTGDQFGREPIQIGPAGGLYPGTQIRGSDELNAETRHRAAVLEKRLNVSEQDGGWDDWMPRPGSKQAERREG